MADISRITLPDGSGCDIKDAVARAQLTKNVNDIAIQTARIDNITKLPEGSTSGDAELIDIRVGGDGVSYDSAGNAVRGQFNKLNEEMNAIRYPYGVNIFCPRNIKRGTFLLPTTGAERDHFNDYNSSDFIEIEPSTRYAIRTFIYSGRPDYSIYYYTSEKEFISINRGGIIFNPEGYSFETPETAAYLRLVFESKSNTKGVQDETSCVLIKGVNTISEFVPYYTSIDCEARKQVTQLKERTNELEIETAEAFTQIEKNGTRTDAIEALIHTYVDGAFVENGVAYFTHDDEVLFEITGIGGGGGGGGGDMTNAVLSVQNQSGWLAKTIATGSDCEVSVLWSSIEDGVPTGKGTMRIIVNGVVRANLDVAQGLITRNVAEYLANGSNAVKIQILDVYGQSRSVNFTVTVMALSISSTFDVTSPFSGAISFPYIPVGSVSKTVHFILDGTEIGTQVTSVTDRQMTYTIPAQPHGGHNLRVYFEASIAEETVRSNELYFEFISIEAGVENTIIVSSYVAPNQKQYTSVVIPFRVYDPYSNTADVKIYVNNALISTQTVDRTEQSYTYRANTVGQIEFRISSNGTDKIISFEVEESEIHIEAETEDLALYLSAQGRSSSEEDRDVWKYESVSASFTNFGWRLDGWQKDNDNIDVLRLVGDARLTIPYKLFGTDFKGTGKTIEIEFSTHSVANYNATIFSCFADNIGLKITPQNVVFKGAQTELSALYKDNEHVRLSITIEKQSGNRLILVYINGIMSRAIQYASGERFSQLSPVDITVGSNECGIDIYTIRVYDNDLNRKQILDNWVADTQIGAILNDRYIRNDVYDDYGFITTATLPKNLPYFVLEASELPQYKGDKKIISGSYTDPLYPARSFTFEGCQINVQGTSSAVYYRKNYDLQFKGGFMTNSGLIEKYALRPGSIPFNRFVLKADVASSESTNNTGLTMFFNDTCPYKKPEQLEDPRVRWGIEGIPVAIFWYNPDDQKTTFLGKANFNLPKRAPEPYGYSNDGTDQSWEWERNNSENVKFQDDDFVSQTWDELEQKYYPTWYDDFEARFPSDEWRDYTQLKEFISWVKSTRRDTATGENLTASVVYTMKSDATVTPYPDDNSYTVEDEMSEGVATGKKIITFTKDTPAYRLSKFRAELNDYVEIESAVFYYIFTEMFLMIDSRAKNMFVGFKGGPINIPGRAMTRKAVFEPYDMDTANGTNNSGVLMFGYYLEDTDKVSGIISGSGGGTDANVFNAQDSVFWVNLRDSCRSEITTMYRNLRTNAWSYRVVETMYENHQSKWPEAVFNEDAYSKYLIPLIEPVTIDESTGKPIKTDRYLTMLQGSKAEQRKWWLYNRFRYMDSKYSTGDASANRITMRLFNAGTLTVTPAIDIYVAVYFGGGTTAAIKRTTANVPVSFVYSQSAQEMETWIDSADLISDVGDLSVFYPNELDFSHATRLRRLQIGSNAAGYSNSHLTTVDVRNSTLLEYIDLRNCPNLAITVNLEGSPRIKEAYFDNTAITGVDLVDGCVIEKLHLPSTITTLTLMNLSNLTDLTVGSYANVTRLMLANMSSNVIDPIAVLKAMPANSQINIQGFRFTFNTTDEIDDLLDLFDSMRGVTRERNANGEWIYHDYDEAQVVGSIHIPNITGAKIAEYKERYPLIEYTYDHIVSYLYYYNYDGTSLLHTEEILDGGNGSYSAQPARSATPQYTYTFVGWSKSKNSTTADSDAATNVIADRTIYAAYTETLRYYTVRFLNGSAVLQTSTVAYGGTAVYTGATPVHSDPTTYQFNGWNPSPERITGNTDCQVVWKDLSSTTRKLIGKTIAEVNNSVTTEVGIYAFAYCSSLTSINLPAATAVGSEAFYNCSSLTSINLPAVRGIAYYAFVDCSSLTSINLPAATSIGEGAFYRCSSLASVYVLASSVCTLVNANAFENTPMSASSYLGRFGSIYVPSSLVSAYKSKTNWTYYADRIIAYIGE